jgi:2-isopropylmalate synthase
LQALGFLLAGFFLMDLEIYDCTLREGEQAHGASFSFNNRIELFKKLDEFGVDYVEVGWPIASKEITESIKECLKISKRAKVVAFGSTSIKDNPGEDENLNSIVNSGAKYACIFGKTSIEHIKKQLKLTEEENLNKIKDSVFYLKSNGLTVFYDAEHYFDGFKDNKDYSIKTLVAALKGGAERLILCDTNGGTIPKDAERILKETNEELKKFGFCDNLGVHFHNDSGLALANTISSLPYIVQVQGTINGIGERIGNLNFSEFLPIYIKKLKNQSHINLKKLKNINEAGYKLAGMNVPEIRTFVGDSAFLHKAGVHIDATKKGISYEHENPEDFGNKRVILMNTLGGRSSIIHIAEKFGYELNKNDEKTKEKIQKLFEELREREMRGYKLGTSEAEQFLLIEKYFNSNEPIFEILEWSINSEYINAKEKSRFLVLCKVNGELVEESLEVEGGPVDAAFKTLKKILSIKHPEIDNLRLADFHVSIAISHEEESAVRTKIDFSDGIDFSTIGVDSNILGSSVEALEKGFRYYLMRKKNKFKNKG